MSIKYAEGRKAWGHCERCGMRYLLKQLTSDGYKPDLLVCQPCWDEDHPQERLPDTVDPITLYEPTGDLSAAQSRDESFVVDGIRIQYGERWATTTIFTHPTVDDRITIEETVDLNGSLSFKVTYKGDSFPPAEEAEIFYVMALTEDIPQAIPSMTFLSWMPAPFGDDEPPHTLGDITLVQDGNSAEISWGNAGPKDLYLSAWAVFYYPSIREMHIYWRAQAHLLLDVAEPPPPTAMSIIDEGEQDAVVRWWFSEPDADGLFTVEAYEIVPAPAPLSVVWDIARKPISLGGGRWIVPLYIFSDTIGERYWYTEDDGLTWEVREADNATPGVYLSHAHVVGNELRAFSGYDYGGSLERLSLRKGEVTESGINWTSKTGPELFDDGQTTLFDNVPDFEFGFSHDLIQNGSGVVRVSKDFDSVSEPYYFSGKFGSLYPLKFATDGAGNWIGVRDLTSSDDPYYWRSSDDGVSWTSSISGPMYRVRDVAHIEGATFVAVSYTSVSISYDNGVSWTSSSDLPNSSRVPIPKPDGVSPFIRDDLKHINKSPYGTGVLITGGVGDFGNATYPPQGVLAYSSNGLTDGSEAWDWRSHKIPEGRYNGPLVFNKDLLPQAE